MAKNDTTFKLPPGPPDLSFKTDEFVKEEFSADKFLQEQRRTGQLEVLRDDLGMYLKILRSAMIELINQDYADFVNLSTNLVGLDRAILGIQSPLGQLREEVLQVQQCLNDEGAKLECLLSRRQRLRERKSGLQMLSRVLLELEKLERLLQGSVEADVLERAVAEYNQLQFCVSKCQKDILSPSVVQAVEHIGNLILSSLETMFVDSIKSNDTENLSRCLRIYTLLDRMNETEILFRRKFVAPYVSDIISDLSLSTNVQALKQFYDAMLYFVENHMKELLHLTLHGVRPPIVKGFNFLVNSFWPEVEMNLEDFWSVIFAPGNADLFYERYTTSMTFLSRLEKHCRSQLTVKALRNHYQYQSFLQRWNLPVYFQLRFQEIAGTVEGLMCDNVHSRAIIEGSEENDFRLSVTDKVWTCILRCWADGVLILQLTHRFWKLSLQLIARYCTWISTVIREPWPEQMPNEDGVVVPVAPPRLTFLVGLHSDVDKLTKRLPLLLETVSRHVSSPVARQLLQGTLTKTEENLQGQLTLVHNAIVEEVSIPSAAILRQVGDIPRLFRRTNREIPSRSCQYVTVALNGPKTFHEENKATVSSSILNLWLTRTFSALTKQFLESVRDVLTSVQKTEESLRRLKKARDRGGGSTAAEGSRGLDDNDKIRLQLALDVQSYAEGVDSLGVTRTEVEGLVQLIELVESARTK